MFKRIVGCLVAAGILFLTIVSARAGETNFRPRLGCIPFLATSLQAMAFTENISASLLDGIDRSSFLEAVERRKIEQILELEGLRLDNLSQESIVSIGVKAGLDYVVHGRVSITESGATIDVNLLNVRSNRQVMRESYRVPESEIYNKVREIAAIIVDRVRNSGAATAEASPPPPVRVVPPPRALIASGSSNSIRLSWSHDDLKQVAGFNIYRACAEKGPFSLHATTTVPQYADENLRLNEVFYYRVATVSKGGGASEQSATVRGETTIAPAPPIFMNVEADIRSARLTWRQRPGAGNDPRMTPQGYRIYRGLSEGSVLTKVSDLPADAVSCVDSGLSEGVKYVYLITSYNRDGVEGDYSARLGMTPLASPATPRAKSLATRQVELSWDRYASDTAEGYVIYRAREKDGTYIQIARMKGVNATSYIDQQSTDTSAFWYRMSAYNRMGEETALSEPVSAITITAPPRPAQQLQPPESRAIHAEMLAGQSR
jgi:fibronectin type 3 domain-containing protein/TolB-like protein